MRCMTVGELRAQLEGVPDHVEIATQHREDAEKELLGGALKRGYNKVERVFIIDCSDEAYELRPHLELVK